MGRRVPIMPLFLFVINLTALCVHRSLYLLFITKLASKAIVPSTA